MPIRIHRSNTVVTACTVLLSVHTLCTAPLPAQEPRARVPDAAALMAAFDSVIPDQMASSHIPGAVLIIVKDGVVYGSRGWGVINRETGAAASPARSIFRLGSITKVVTATAAMQQVDRGRLSLDADVNSYLPAWKVAAAYPQPITLASLLTHTAALDEISAGRKTGDPAAVKPLGDFLRDRTVRLAPVGAFTSYSTYGISLAGYLVEIATNRSLKQVFQQDIFAPLGMTRSSLGAPDAAHRADVATGYDYAGNRYHPEPWEYFHTYPASDMNATAEDMAKFMIAHLDGESRGSAIMSDTMTRRMHTVQVRNDPRILGVAYGFFEHRFHGYRALYHGGTMSGFKASMWLWPEQRLGLFLAYNREIDDLERRVLNRFAARALLPVLDSADTEGVSWTKPRVKDDLRRFVGQYRPAQWCHRCTGERGYMPAAIDVRLVNDSTITFWGGEWAQVEPMRFRLMNGQLEFGQLYVAFRADSSGKVTALATGGPWWNERIGTSTTTASSATSTTAASSTRAVVVSAATLERYVGPYSLPVYGTVTVGRDDAGLFADVAGQARVRLVPLSSSRFTLTEFGAEVSFTRHWWQRRATTFTLIRKGQPDVRGERVRRE